MPSARPVVVTSCTARKKQAASGALRLRLASAPSSLEALAEGWRDQLRTAVSTHHVGDLYAGRGFRQAQQAAAFCGAALHVVSAGLGLVGSEDLVPAYDLTAASKTSSLSPLLDSLSADPAAWWRQLTGGAPLTQLIVDTAPSTVLMALPSSYLEMLRDDLAEVPAAHLKRLRIFTSGLGAAILSERLQRTVMPYDDRLEALRGWSGTRSDFPQRALWHFVKELQGHRLSAIDGRTAVHDALQSLQAPTRAIGARLDDAALRRWIQVNWAPCDGSTTRLLSRLRHDAGLACEQGRFAQLCRDIRATRQEERRAAA